jgi:hypothetical protein
MIVVQQPEPPTSSPTADGIHADREHDAGWTVLPPWNRGSLARQRTKNMPTRTTGAVSNVEPPGTSSTLRTRSTNP